MNCKIHSLITCNHGHTILDDCPLPSRLKSGLHRHSDNRLKSASSTTDDKKNPDEDWQTQVLRHYLPPDRYGGQRCKIVRM